MEGRNRRKEVCSGGKRQPVALVHDLTSEQYEEDVDGAPLALEHPPLKDIPIVQEHIPYNHLPNIILVYDADDVTTLIERPSVPVDASSARDGSVKDDGSLKDDGVAENHDSTKDDGSVRNNVDEAALPPKRRPIQYRRVLPDLKAYGQVLQHRQRVPAVASLVLHAEHLLGVDHHSVVHDGVLKISTPLTTADGSGFVRVAVKTAFQ